MNSKNNLVITNARIVTPLGHEAVRGRTMRHLNVIEHGRVEVKDGIISYVGSDEKSIYEKSSKDGRPQSTNTVRTINAQGHCLLPGFVDSHTHFVFGGFRAEEFSWRLRGESYMSIMQRGGGIVNTVNATRALSAEKMKDRALRLVNRMAMMGVTTVEGKSGYGLDFDTELRQLEVMRQLTNDPNRLVDVVPTFLGAHAVPEEYKGRTDYYVDFLIDKLLPCVSSRKLAEFCDVFCEEGVFSIDQSRRLLIAAQTQGLALKIHADEIVSTGGAELAAELGAVSADHLLHVSDAGIEAMAKEGVVATLLPLTAFALREPYARGRAMIDADCAVALATDLNPGSCFSGSIPLTFALACIYMELTVEEAITALTINGAAALRRADRIGSIEVGKQADFVLLSSDDYNVLPYYVGMNCVSAIIKNGEPHLIDEKFQVSDEQRSLNDLV